MVLDLATLIFRTFPLGCKVYVSQDLRLTQKLKCLTVCWASWGDTKLSIRTIRCVRCLFS